MIFMIIGPRIILSSGILMPEAEGTTFAIQTMRKLYDPRPFECIQSGPVVWLMVMQTIDDGTCMLESSIPQIALSLAV